MDFVIMVIASFAITNILVNEDVFKWLRERISWQPFHCARCMSVWVGAAFPWVYDTLHAGTPSEEYGKYILTALCTHAVVVYIEEMAPKY